MFVSEDSMTNVKVEESGSKPFHSRKTAVTHSSMCFSKRSKGVKIFSCLQCHCMRQKDASYAYLRLNQRKGVVLARSLHGTNNSFYITADSPSCKL